MKNFKILTILSLVILLSLTTGCLFKSSSNPVGTDVDQPQQLAQKVDSNEPMVKASVFSEPKEREYTFAKNGHKVGHSFRENVKKLKGSLKVRFLGQDSTEKILLSFNKMKVKPESGRPVRISLDTRTIDMLSATDLAEVLADQELDEGIYKYLEFSINKAQIVVDGETRDLFVPSKRVRFFGKFEIKEGYTTNLTVKFLHRLIQWKAFARHTYMMIPIVKISSELVLKPVEATDGDITGYAESFVDGSKLAGIDVSLEGTSHSAVTAADGSFAFEQVPAGFYTLKTSHPDYLDHSFQLEVIAGQVASAVVQLNPAVIRSNVANTGWFSEYYPFADANGEYGEVALETPIEIDFVSLAF
ncbi:MAG: carboxypeptidase-like regulatory domain-containing protein, partial [Candidatus Rifleibacteriota bacterium]